MGIFHWFAAQAFRPRSYCQSVALTSTQWEQAQVFYLVYHVQHIRGSCSCCNIRVEPKQTEQYEKLQSNLQWSYFNSQHLLVLRGDKIHLQSSHLRAPTWTRKTIICGPSLSKPGSSNMSPHRARFAKQKQIFCSPNGRGKKYWNQQKKHPDSEENHITHHPKLYIFDDQKCARHLW